MNSIRYFFFIFTLYGNIIFTQNLIPNIVSTYNDNSVKKIINHKITGKKIIQDSYQLFREDGTLILEGKLKDGIEHGQGSYYDENGRKYTGNQIKDIEAIKNFDDPRLSNGKWHLIFDGEHLVALFKLNTSGKHYVIAFEGVFDKRKEGHLLDEKQDGKWINYYNNRKTSEGNYKNGEKVGRWKRFDDDGKVIDYKEF